MKIKGNKTGAIIAIFLMLSMSASTLLAPNALAQVNFPPGYKVATYAFINVAPNPIGVGQQVNVNFFLSSVIETSERPTNMVVKITDPTGTTTSKGPYTGDTTGGTFFNFVPDKVGNWTFQFFYGGQTTIGSNYTGFGNLVEMPSTSKPYTLVVQQEPIVQTAYPITPLPTAWWQTPVSAENVQQWSHITGDWLGLGSITFASTGTYNATTRYNPYTAPVLSGHVLWTKEWLAGGVAGGESVGASGGTEDSGHYWSTRQYQPQYAPVIINGKMYSTAYPEATNLAHGIICTDLYTGATLWTINTTNSLRCGMVVKYHMANQYGAVGPYIWTTGTLPAADTGGRQIGSQTNSAGATIPSPYMNTTGTQWNLYSGWDGKYICSIVNGSALTLREDDNGNLLGYYINSTKGTERTYPSPGSAAAAGSIATGNPTVMVTTTGPHLTCVNLTMALGMGAAFGWGPTQNNPYNWQSGVMWTVTVPTATDDGKPIASPLVSPSLSLSLNSITGNELMLSAGFVHMQGGGDEVPGWLVYCAMDVNDGHELYCKNYTYAAGATEYLPFTRTSRGFGDGSWATVNLVSWDMNAYDSRTGNKIWSSKLQTPYGDGTPNSYDNFGISNSYVNGKLLWYGLGGDIWCQDSRTGKQLWYTNTTTLIGDPGIETPYDVWPLWVFSSPGYTTDVAYLTIGHEYNPPLFHGSQMLAVNMTDGSLVWSELGMYIRSTAIADNIMLSMNAYDNQIYAFGKGPSTMTVSAPSVGVSTATPITISGTVMDISPGTRAITQPDITLTKQNEIALNFPNGIPCVSDASQSRWMEYVYQQQPAPTNTKGVAVTLSVLDANNNFRTIGTPTSDATGTFSYTWTPDIPGDYTIIASFAGSNSYYGSSATTHVYASSPAATHEPTATPVTGLATSSDVMYVGVAIIIAVIIAIAIVGLLILRKH
jgi:hypothetical protein